MSISLGQNARWEASYLAFVYQQLFYRPPPVHADLSGQVAIITGANSGLGLEAGRQLLQLGLSRLILAVRSQTKGDVAATQLRREFPHLAVEVWLVDMASFESIQAFVARCSGAELERIDIIILNAGVQNWELTTVESTGYETTFQVNYLSTALLSSLLLPVLRSKRGRPGQPARLVVVNSDTQYWVDFEPSGPVLPRVAMPKQPFKGFEQYSLTKLLMTGFVTKLAEAVNEDEVIVSIVNPGLVSGTDLIKTGETPWVTSMLLGALSRRLEWGASTYVDAVVNKSRESHGSFVSNWAIKPFPVIYYTAKGREMRERLWEETLEELRFAGVSAIVSQLATSKSQK